MTRSLHGDHPQVTYQFAGDHVDLSDPSWPISWPDDEWTQHRAALVGVLRQRGETP